jgi:hypothetical protein
MPASAAALQVQRRGAVAQQQGQRTLVIDEMAERVLCRLGAAGRHRRLVVAGMLHHLYAALAQALLLPFLGLQRHMHHGREAQGRRGHAYGQAQVAGGAHGHRMARKQGARRRTGQGQIVVRPGLRAYQSMPQGQALGKLQHLMHAAARLDGAGHGQQMVGLEPQTPLPDMQAGRRQQRRLDHARRGLQLGEQARQQRRETRKPRRGGARIVQADGAAGHRLRPGKHRLPPGVEPQTGFGPAQQGREGRIRGGQGVILGRHGHNCFQIYSF